MKKKSLVFDLYIAPNGWVNFAFDFPQNINWNEFNTIKFMIYGKKSNLKYSIQIVDKDGEFYIYFLKDDWEGWKQISIPIKNFKYRMDYQESTVKRKNKINYPLKSCIFENNYFFNPSTGKLTLIINEIEITRE